MRVTRTGIAKVAATARTAPRRPNSGQSVTDADMRETNSAHSSQLPVIHTASPRTSSRTKSASRNSAQFLTQMIAQSDSTHSEARLARRYPQQAMNGYANATSLKRGSKTQPGARLHLDAV